MTLPVEVSETQTPSGGRAASECDLPSPHWLTYSSSLPETPFLSRTVNSMLIREKKKVLGVALVGPCYGRTFLSFCWLHSFCLFLFFWPCHTACEILVRRPGVKPEPLPLEARSPNHWTSREESPGLRFCADDGQDSERTCSLALWTACLQCWRDSGGRLESNQAGRGEGRVPPSATGWQVSTDIIS